MFGKKRKTESRNDETNKVSLSEPKYKKPKIILIDLSSNVEVALRGKGYNVVSGSFGHQYKVKPSASGNPVTFNSKLPNYGEQEVIIADLGPGEIGGNPEKERDSGFWTRSRQDVIDPRPLAMAFVRGHSDRIAKHGGIFIIFAAPRYSETYCTSEGREYDRDNWSLLGELDSSHILVKPDHGYELQVIDAQKNIVSQVLAKHTEQTEFLCILKREFRTGEEKWFVIAENKFGQTVSVAVHAEANDKKRPCFLLIFPHMQDKAAFLLDLMDNVLPALSPHLFPFSEKSSWLYSKPYELPKVNELKDAIENIEEECNTRVATTKGKIEKFREENKFLYNLLAETDDLLVDAVIAALRSVGFEQVVDVDKELEATGESGSLREDIQVKDSPPILIIDVKGITGLPSDADALQSQKHAMIRMKEWDRTDVNPLTIINHQRHLPPLDRENRHPFREEIIKAASQAKLGLMTTWDLHRLVRSSLKNKWQPSQTKPLFYRDGRIPAIPVNYEYVGAVNKVWPQAEAFSVLVQESSLSEECIIGVETPVEITEYKVKSLQLDDASVQEVVAGKEAGVKTTQFPESVKKGYRIYKVIS